MGNFSMVLEEHPTGVELTNLNPPVNFIFRGSDQLPKIKQVFGTPSQKIEKIWKFPLAE